MWWGLIFDSDPTKKQRNKQTKPPGKNDRRHASNQAKKKEKTWYFRLIIIRERDF